MSEQSRDQANPYKHWKNPTSAIAFNDGWADAEGYTEPLDDSYKGSYARGFNARVAYNKANRLDGITRHC